MALDLKAALPDLAATLDDVSVAADGNATAMLTVRGTHQADLWGAPGSGAVIEWVTPVSIRAVGDRFAVNFEEMPAPQRVGLLRQLRLVNPADEMDQPPHYPVAIPEFLLKLAFTGEAGDRPCAHLDQIKVTEPTVSVCEQCVELGDIWPASAHVPHLRVCRVLRHVQEPAHGGAPPGDRSSDHALDPPRGGMDLVLRRRRLLREDRVERYR